MPFDYKKEYKEFYLPEKAPQIVDVPEMRFIAVEGAGDPNEPDGAYKRAIELLYGLAFTIKMSRRAGHAIDGFFDYVVPPLEGFWRQSAGGGSFDYADKRSLRWISVIRLPDFVSRADFDWAVRQASDKKGKDFSAAKFLTLTEGLCVQCMHVGSYDDEPATIEHMRNYITEQGYTADFSLNRLHHEIYLSDPRRCDPTKLKTVIRHPIRPSDQV